MVEGGALRTKPEQAGILAGITRAHVLASRSRWGFAVREEEIRRTELAGAAEALPHIDPCA